MGLKKKVTTKDIADHVGLSQSAVSMILNNKSNVSFSESTKKKVFDAAKELGYQKKKKQTESKNKPLSKVILIICPFLSPILTIGICLDISFTSGRNEVGYR